MLGLDYSAGRPTGAQIKAAGYDFVVRYVGTPGRAKNITAAEYRDLTAAGVAVALVYENRAGDALAGRAAGQSAARAARADADSIGFPAGRPIYFACDTDVTSQQQFRAVMEYLRGAGDVLGGPSRVGVYGEYDVTTRARLEGVTAYEWQTVAWSRGMRDKDAELFQRLGYVYVGAMAADVNERGRLDFGQHNYQQEDDDMFTDEDRKQLRFVHDRLAGVTEPDTRFYVTDPVTGQPREVPPGTKDAVPNRLLTALDGDVLRRAVLDADDTPDEIAGAVAARVVPLVEDIAKRVLGADNHAQAAEIVKQFGAALTGGAR